MKSIRSLISNERLREVLDYECETGVFRWRLRASTKCVIGAVAGCQTPEGYIRITIDGVPHMAHRLAWQYVHGYRPETLIDHRNRIKNDNRLENLRLTSSERNADNAVWGRTNKGGFRGIYRCKKSGKWIATIRVGGGKRVGLGAFDRAEDAGAAYAAAHETNKPHRTPEAAAADAASARGSQ